MDESELRDSLTTLHTASFAWAVACCRDREVAAEVLQSVYLKVLSQPEKFTGRSSFRTWLFAVIRNAAIDYRRQRWWSRVLSLDVESLLGLSDPRNTTNGNRDDIERVRLAIQRLPERQRQVTHLVFYEDLTLDGAAEVMGISVGSARQHYARAKAALGRSLGTTQALPSQRLEPNT